MAPSSDLSLLDPDSGLSGVISFATRLPLLFGVELGNDILQLFLDLAIYRLNLKIVDVHGLHRVLIGLHLLNILLRRWQWEGSFVTLV